MALTRDIYGEISRYLPAGSLGRLAQVSRETRITPRIELCCSQPTPKEFIDYLIRLMPTIPDFTEDEMFENTIEYRQIGLSFSLSPALDTNEIPVWEIRYRKQLIKRLYKRAQMEEYLLAPKLTINEYNIPIFVKILMNRGACLSIPDYIDTCIRRWFREELVSIFMAEEESKIGLLRNFMDNIPQYIISEENLEKLSKGVGKIISEVREEYPQYYEAAHWDIEMEFIPEKFSPEGVDIIKRRVLALFDSIPFESIDVASFLE